jgi:tRNA pseudouridine-54 N-methylase
MNILYLSANPSQEVNTFILTAIKRLKNTVISGVLLDTDTKKVEKLALVTKEIKRTDAVILETTNVNFDMGRLMTLSIFQHKPVLLLQEKGKEQGVELGANRLVNNKTYIIGKDAELERKIEDFMKAVKKQRLTYRFNLMLSRDINTYLAEQSADKNISKADYIRSLIIQDMGV